MLRIELNLLKIMYLLEIHLSNHFTDSIENVRYPYCEFLLLLPNWILLFNNHLNVNEGSSILFQKYYYTILSIEITYS